MSNFLASTLGLVSPKYRTLSQWADVYFEMLQSQGLHKKTLINRRSYIRRILEYFGGESLVKIKAYAVLQMLDQVRQTQPFTAKRMFFELRKMLNEAIKYDWLDKNPLNGLTAPRTQIQRSRMTLQDWVKMYNWASKNSMPWAPRMLLLALLTGQRRADLQKLQKTDVYDGLLHVEQQKTGARIAIPLNLKLDVIDCTLEQALAACSSYLCESSFYLHKSNGQPPVLESMSYRFEHIREHALGLWTGNGSPFSLHEIRSLSARLYYEQGGIDVVTLLGHTSPRMTQVYLNSRNIKQSGWRVLKV